MKYPDRSHASSRKTNLALEQGVASSSSAAGRPGDTKPRKDTKHREKISPLTYLYRTERGEGVPCMQCDYQVNKSSSYVCKRCNLDNHKQAHRRMIDISESAIEKQVPGIDYEAFPKEK